MRNTSEDNPYASSSLGNIVDKKVIPPKWVYPCLWLIGFSGSLGPVALLCWVVDGEPFVGPAEPLDTLFCLLSVVFAVAWLGWAIFICVGIFCRWFGVTFFGLLILPVIFGGLSVFVSYAYLVDRGWF